MSKFLRSFVTVLLCISVFFALATSAVAASIDPPSIMPYSYPTISSTICGTCHTQMKLLDGLYREEAGSSKRFCENAPGALAPHTHWYADYYKVYACSSCNARGKIWAKRTERCELAMNEYAIVGRNSAN